MTEELLKHIVQEKKAYLDMRTADYCNRSNNLKSVVLVGKADSVFLSLVAKRCAYFGIQPIFQYPQVDVLRTPGRSAVVFDTDDRSVTTRCSAAIMLGDIDCVNTTGMSSVAEALYELLQGANLVSGKSICIIGRGHAVQGLAAMLSKFDATVTVCHSKTRLNPIFTNDGEHKMYPAADIVICAAPKLDGVILAHELVIDISGAAKDACINKKSIYFNGIGPLTIAVLVNRITVHCMNGVCA